MRVLITLLLFLVSHYMPSVAVANEHFEESNQQVTTLASLVGPIEVQPAADRSFTDLVVSVVLDPAPGWHVYWRFPGDAGKPPVTTFHLPPGVSVEGPLVWPAPERFTVAGLTNFGYSGRVVLPYRLRFRGELPPQATISAVVTWLACKEDCIPGKQELELQLPAATLDRTILDEVKVITTDLLQSVQTRRVRELTETDTHIEVSIELPDGKVVPEQLAFFPYSGGQIQLSAPQSFTVDSDNQGKMLRISLLKVSELQGKRALGAIAGELYQHDSNLHVVIPASPAQGSVAITFALPKGVSFWGAILFAMLGGLILNLMPCVFPVLSIKALSLMNMGAKCRRDMLTHSLWYTAGVVLSFMVLGAGVVLARQLGSSLGWGFQLQNPYVVLAGIFVLFLLALNFFGVFEVGMRLQAVAGSVPCGASWRGDFLTGVLAVLLASPCTAPFMGTAISAAMLMSPVLAVSVFAALGLGMALPFLLLPLLPGIARIMPRPGAWMVTLKQILGLPLLGATLWLLWVYAQVVSRESALVVAGLLVGVGLVAWWYERVYSRQKTRGRQSFMAATFVVVLACLFAGAAATVHTHGADEDQQLEQLAADIVWQRYSPALLEQVIAAKKPFYLDVTAAWCITCQVNKKVVFSSPAVLEVIRRKQVALIQADWTNGDSTITALLQIYNHEGVPLTVISSGGDALPQELPQVLTPGMVLEALE